MKDLGTALGRELAALEAEDSAYVKDDVYTLRVYGKDLWPRRLIEAREEPLGPPSIQAVVWPKDVKSLQRLVKTASERGWELYPYGAGSGVCGGAVPEAGSVAKRPRIVVDLKRMDAIEVLDGDSGVAKIQAGIIGQVLEEDLNQKGFTMGHFPSSIYCSSFGGYLATRAAGQLSTYYGKIEDMVLAIEGVLPDGDFFATPVTPRLAMGPDWNQLFLGSEGTLAFLTAGWVKIHRLPESRRFVSYQVSSTAEALDGVRSWLQGGLRPAAVRIYDEDESRMLHGVKNGSLLIAMLEGDLSLTEFTENRMRQLVEGKRAWVDTGEEPAEHWWAHRYDVSYRQQQVMSHQRMILDTFEVSTVWSKLPALHAAVKASVKEFSDSGMIVALAHFSHFYHTGANIYFTIAGRARDNIETVGFYDAVWEKLLEACVAQGAAISHHHGIGRLKTGAFENQRGPLFPLYRKLKNAVDPGNILNPENLGL